MHMAALSPETQYWTADGPKPLHKRRPFSTSITSFRDTKPPPQVEVVRENVQEFAANTTFHGLGHVIKSQGFRSKCFWVVIVFIVFVMVCLQLHKLLVYFTNNPTTTQVNVVYPREGLKFPNLTVCTLQKFNHTRMKQRYPKMTKILAEFSLSSFLSAYSTALMDLTYFKRDFSISYVTDTTFQCRNQFLLCWFENGYIFDCCAKKAKDRSKETPVKVKKYLLHSGPCFEFQIATSHQRLPGPVGGFGFAFWYPNDDMFPSVYKAYDEHALHVYSSLTDAMLEKNPIVLPVGSHARISLQAVKTSRLRQDQLGRVLCSEKTLKYFDNYSYAGCQVECLVDNLLEQCNCIGITTYGDLPKNKICSPKAAFECFKKLAFNFTTMLSECRLEHCQESCSYWRYIVSLTAGRVFIPKMEKAMLSYWRLPPGDTKNSLIIADVYFSDIEFTDIVQVPAMTIESFVSSIGGAMGLWTGASIVTWIHLLYFCLRDHPSVCSRNKPGSPGSTRTDLDPEDPMDSTAQRRKSRRDRKRSQNNNNRSLRKPKKTVTKIKLDKAISVSIEQTERQKMHPCGQCCGLGRRHEESDDVIEESDDSGGDAYGKTRGIYS